MRNERIIERRKRNVDNRECEEHNDVFVAEGRGILRGV